MVIKKTPLDTILQTMVLNFYGKGVAPSFETVINNKFGELLAYTNSAIWNNNLYIPIGQTIFKLILLPDCDKDEEIFDAKYVATIRKLDDSEYYISYNKTEDNDSISIENDFIETDAQIKNLYFDKNGNLFAFNFDHLAISADGDTAYGVYGSESYIEVGGWYYVYAQSLSKMLSGLDTSKFAEFASPKSIDLIKVNSFCDIALVRGFSTSFDENNEKMLEIYDNTKALYYTASLDILDKVLSLDAYTYIDEEGEEKCVFTLLGTSRR